MIEERSEQPYKSKRLYRWSRSAGDAVIRLIYFIPIFSLFSVRYLRWIFSAIFTCIGLLSFAFPAAAAISIYYYYDDMAKSVAGIYVTVLWIVTPLTVILSASYALREALLESINDILKGINVLAIRYVTQHLINSFVGLAIVFVFSLGYFIFEHDQKVLIVPIVYSFSTLGYGSVVYWRSKRGLFGSNATEAYELLAYMFEARSFIDGPPGLDRVYPGFYEQSNASIAEGAVSGGKNA